MDYSNSNNNNTMDLDDLCAFCLDRIHDPVQLHCMHHFCRSCWSLYREARNWQAKRCPLCRRSLEACPNNALPQRTGSKGVSCSHSHVSSSHWYQLSAELAFDLYPSAGSNAVQLGAILFAADLLVALLSHAKSTNNYTFIEIYRYVRIYVHVFSLSPIIYLLKFRILCPINPYNRNGHISFAASQFN